MQDQSPAIFAAETRERMLGISKKRGTNRTELIHNIATRVQWYLETQQTTILKLSNDILSHETTVMRACHERIKYLEKELTEKKAVIEDKNRKIRRLENELYNKCIDTGKKVFHDRQ